jgi:ribosomal protein L40E
MLAAIYNWFTEGFDTADLRDAKALLEELAGYLVMRCTRCNYENPADAVFCIKCGGNVEKRCVS